MKRFTETEKWRDQWFRKLPIDHKMAFTYLCENCDSAGVWEPDCELANFCIGVELDWDAVLTAMGDRVLVLPNGKWYLTRFVEFQNGPLSEGCKPHAKILALLRAHGIPTTNNEGYHIPYTKGIHTHKERRGEEEDKDKGGEGTGIEDAESMKTATTAPKKPAAAFPGELPLETAFPPVLDTPQFRAAWAEWIAYRRDRKLPKLIPKSEAAQLSKLAAWGHDGAIASIRESISQQWQGLFAPKNSTPNHANNRTGSPRGFSQQQTYAGVTQKL
jgi:hypothetical protein